MKRSERIEIFVEEIWHWFSNHKRVLPWRDLQIADPTERAYQVLVSEIMLQQTQVPRVEVVFKRFLQQFPKLSDLAQATNSEVIIAWRGMGYNSRALRLRDAAKTIVARYSLARDSMDFSHKQRATSQRPTFPQSMNELMSIPGIGHYTAAAVRNFAFNLPTPCIDTNIRRILHRVFVGPENSDGSWEKNDEYLLEIASEALEIAGQKGDAANWHAALMDFGSLVCTKRNPKWEICPLTAREVMKTTPALWKKLESNNEQRATSQRREPGRLVGSVFIPNRIFRGKVVEALRQEPHGLTLDQLGSQVCIDWEERHREWLQSLIKKLIQDRMLAEAAGRYMLS